MMYPFDCITNFIFVEHTPVKSDAILVAGGSRPQLILKAAELYKNNYAPYILISGGPNQKLKDWNTEFDYLNQVALSSGIPEKAILKENQARNTFDNAQLSLDVLQKNNVKINKLILICKTHHARRALLTYQSSFPACSEFSVIPIVDERDIQKNNWFLDQSKIEIVMKELEKIGQYFGKHIPNMRVC